MESFRDSNGDRGRLNPNGKFAAAKTRRTDDQGRTEVRACRFGPVMYAST